MELIEQLTSKLGINGEQAEGATGALLNFAKKNLAGADFQSIADKIPGASQWMEKAPAEDSENSEGGGGLLGSLGGIANSLGGSMGGLAGLTSIFAKLGLGPDMIAKVTETISGYLGDSKLSGMLGGILGGGKSE